MKSICFAILALVMSGCAKPDCGPDCRVFDQESIGSFAGEESYDERFDRNGDGQINTIDYAIYLQDCS